MKPSPRPSPPLHPMLAVLALATASMPAFGASPLSPAETRAIAKEAYIYEFPLVDNYRVQYSHFVDKTSPEYKGEWNQIHNTARVSTPDDRPSRPPNSDTPYTMVGANTPYYYASGVYYKTVPEGGYVAVPAPTGAILAAIPPGSVPVMLGPQTFYYHNGIYYLQQGTTFVVQPAPIGIVAPTLLP